MRSWKAVCAVLALGLGACVHDVRGSRTELAPASDADKTIVVQFSVRAPLESRQTAWIPGASTWRLAGKLPQGDVYRPVKGVFTITSGNTHEAYLVISSDDLVGFFLPGEGSFVPLSRKSNGVKLKIHQGRGS